MTNGGLDDPTAASERPSSAPRRGLLVCQELFFASRISQLARDVGWTVQYTMQFQEALRRLAAEAVPIVIVDLALPGLDVQQLIEAIPADSKTQVVGFGPHVDGPAFQRARAAGFHVLLPHSRLAADLPGLLRELAAG